MSWGHKVLKRSFPEGEVYEVCEDFEYYFGHTGGISPMGESLEELEWELTQMLHAVQETIAGNRRMIEENDDAQDHEVQTQQ